MRRSLVVQFLLKFLDRQPMRAILVVKPRFHPFLVFGIGSVSEMKEESGQFPLLCRRERRDITFDFLKAHRSNYTRCTR